jgi:AcrR family transcriptional regulator
MRTIIQQEALRMFLSQGYDETTVEQIADASDISRATFFRYFSTKADIVLTNVFDDQIIEMLLVQPASERPIEALRNALRGSIGDTPSELQEHLRQRFALLHTVPELRERVPDNIFKELPSLAAALAQRMGRPADDFAVLSLAGAILGVAAAAWIAIRDDLTPGSSERYHLLIDSGLAYLDAGFSLEG